MVHSDRFIQGHRFQNWAKTFSCTPSSFVQAHSEQEVVDIVRYAQQQKLKIRVVGTGHSPSDIACTNGIMLNLDPMNRLVSIDLEKKQVTVEAGIKLWQLNALLDERGLAMSNLGSISEQSIGGLISTGTHGTGVNFGCIGTNITSLRMVISTGDVLVLRNDSLDEDERNRFLAAVCSLGCLGVITEVTIQTVDQFQVRAIQKPLLFDEMISQFEAEACSADHVRFWWFPHTEDCIVWKGTRTSDPPVAQESNWLKDRLVGVHGLELALYASTQIPSLVPKINKTYFEMFFRQPTTSQGKSFDVFNFDCLFSQYVTEWAIDRKKAPEALQRLKSFLEKNPHIVAHSPVEIRFVKKDDIFMSMSYGVDTCFIGIIIYRPFGKDVPHDAYWAGYETIMNDLGGRPHWAKAHKLTREDLQARYPKLPSFLAIRERLDPHDMFTNDYIDRHILGRLQINKSKL